MKVNKKFIEDMQKRIDKKELIYGGETNPKNYKNMKNVDLAYIIIRDAKELFYCSPYEDLKEKNSRLCIDIANRCLMIWDKLQDGGE